MGGESRLTLDATTLHQHQLHLEQSAEEQADQWLREAISVAARKRSQAPQRHKAKQPGVYMAQWMINILQEHDKIRDNECLELPAKMKEAKRQDRNRGYDPAQVEQQARRAQKIQDKRSHWMRNNHAASKYERSNAKQ